MCEVLDWYIEQGMEQAEERITKLGKMLLAENRKEDAFKMFVDKEYRYSLYAKYGI